MATHSSTLAWKIPWMEEPGRLQSKGQTRLSDFAFANGTETLSHPCCAENMGVQITHDLTHFQIRVSAAWEQPADTTFPAPQAGISLRSGLLSHFSVPEPWLRDFSHEKANHKTKGSEVLSHDSLYLKQNVGKFKLKGALKSNDSFSGKQLRGE